VCLSRFVGGIDLPLEAGPRGGGTSFPSHVQLSLGGNVHGSDHTQNLHNDKSDKVTT